MKLIITKLIPIIALILFTLWFAQDYDYEPLIGMLMSVGGLVGIEYWSNTKLSKWDHDLVIKFMNELPSTCDAISLLSNHDFLGPFMRDGLRPLNRIRNEWCMPDHHFRNRILNRKMNEFMKRLDVFMNLIGVSTAPIETRADVQDINYSDKSSDKAKRKAHEINESASAAYEAYQSLVDKIRKYDVSVKK